MGFFATFTALLSVQLLILANAAVSSTTGFRRDAQKPLLRIMPLGASITQGYDNNVPEDQRSGYRKPLRDQLRSWGYGVNMVGSRSNGDFHDRQHEGWPGYEISEVVEKITTTEKPNLVLILLGTNDCLRARREDRIEFARSAKDRMRALVLKMCDSSPGVTIILATLPATTDAGDELYIEAANAGYRDLYHDLLGQNKKIELAEMHTEWLQPSDHSDAIHFNAGGYAKMAAIFAKAFQRVESRGWLVSPVDTGIRDNAGCLPSPDGFRGPVRTQQGNGYDDGEGMMYCDMYGRGRDDYLWVSTDGNVHVFENMLSPPSWSSHGRILETKRDRKSVHFGDWDGDGLCDVLVVDRWTGNFDMFRNTYQPGAEVPTFDTAVRVINSALCPQADEPINMHDLAVRFGDLDGDGRVDYICMDRDGRSSAWFNKPNELQTAPSTIPNQIKVSEGFQRSEFRWADVNGDGNVDLLAIYQSTNAVQVWINRGIKRASTSGMEWERRNGVWIPGTDSGVNVHFPRLSTSRRADYHVISPQTNNAYTWFNEGRCGGGAEDDGPVRDPGLPKMQ